MKNDYKDIIRAAGGQPVLWYDDNGTPRFSAFRPDMVPDIYADEVVLLRISCQGCGKRFLVSISSSEWDRIRMGFDPLAKEYWKDSGVPRWPLAEKCEKGTIHYGDPPNTDCCPTGPTMNSIPLVVVQYWRRDPRNEMFRWARLEEYELLIEDPFYDISDEEIASYNHSHDEEE